MAGVPDEHFDYAACLFSTLGMVRGTAQFFRLFELEPGGGPGARGPLAAGVRFAPRDEGSWGFPGAGPGPGEGVGGGLRRVLRRGGRVQHVAEHVRRHRLGQPLSRGAARQ